MKNKRLLAIAVTLAFLSPHILGALPHAQASGPYQKTFIVTAYYSPLPGQEFYVTGSLASDKRLNGNGTHGADGTPVYAGMIAAPSTYAFGTRVNCPGYIDGEIHDRGGAIVKAGVRSNAYDRLDFWAGHGDEALKTALYWGKRTLTCTVYPPGYSGEFQQYVSLPNAPIQYGVAQRVAQTSAPYKKAAASAGIPQRYRKALTDLGYDPDDKASRIAFQLRHEIINTADEAVAGNVGPGTKGKLDEILAATKNGIPIQDLEFGMVNAQVRQLQHLLKDAGYLSAEPTAIFGEQTKAALIQFQLDQNLIDSEQHAAAGYVGPGTQKAFQEMIYADYLMSDQDRALVAELNRDKTTAASLAKANALENPETDQQANEYDDEYQDLLKTLSEEWIKEHTPAEQASATITLASAKTDEAPELEALKAKLAPVLNPFDDHLRVGSKGEDVRKTQELLKELGFFEGKQLTDYFGPQTRQAVINFQLEYDIVEQAWSAGAGIVGPKTVKALNASYYQHRFSLPFEVGNIFRAPAVNPTDLNPLVPLQQAQAAQQG